MTIHRLHGLCALALVLAPVATGCLAAMFAAGAGTYGIVRYVENGAERDFACGLELTWDAAVAAARAGGRTIDAGARLAEDSGSFEAGDLRVRVRRVSEAGAGGLTRVHARVGAFDREANLRAAELYLTEVAVRLGEG